MGSIEGTSSTFQSLIEGYSLLLDLHSRARNGKGLASRLCEDGSVSGKYITGEKILGRAVIAITAITLVLVVP